jgi:hypothetical protein
MHVQDGGLKVYLFDVGCYLLQYLNLLALDRSHPYDLSRTNEKFLDCLDHQVCIMMKYMMDSRVELSRSEIAE